MPQKKFDEQPIDEQPVFDEQPIDEQPVEDTGEGPTIARAQALGMNPNYGGRWEGSGISQRWISPVDLEHRPDNQIFGGYESLTEKLRGLRIPILPGVNLPAEELANFIIGNAAAPENFAGAAGLLTQKAAVPWLERIAAENLKPQSQPMVKAFEGVELKPESFIRANEISTGTGSKITNKSVEGVTTAADVNYGITKAPPSEISTVLTVNPSKPEQVLKQEPYREGMKLRKNQEIVKPYPYNVVPSQFEPKPFNFLEEMTPSHIAEGPVHSTVPRVVEANRPASDLANVFESNNAAFAAKQAGIPVPEPPKIDDQIVTRLIGELGDRKDLTLAEKAVAADALRKVITGKKPSRNEFNLLGHIYGKDEMIRIVHALPPEGETRINYWADRLNLPRALQASFDLSAPFRQGVGLIHRGEWWRSWNGMVRSFGSEKTYQGIMDSIRADELFKPRAYFEETLGARGNIIKTPKVKASYADEAGLALTDLAHITSREEALASNLAEKIPLGIGRGVRASNRAYTAFLNKLRADTFKSMIKDSRIAYETSKKLANTAEEMAQVELMNPDTNLVLRKAIAQYINNASGRGSLGAAEKYATALNTIFYSPRLIASRVNMVKNLAFAPRGLQKEYWKSMGALAGLWTTVASLGHVAGADVSFDPTNSDFLKIKFGNTRIDPGAGFLQYAVFLSRFGLQRTTSSTTTDPGTGEPRVYDLNSKYGGDTIGDVTRRFIANKFNPIGKEAHDWMFERKTYAPYNYADRAAKLITPFVLQDLTDIVNDDPNYLPLIIPSTVGMGLSTYERGDKNTFFGEGGAVPKLLGQ